MVFLSVLIIDDIVKSFLGVTLSIFGEKHEIFAQPLFTAPHEPFDPSMGLLTKSQKLGLTASNSLQFAHQGGPFALPGWVPQKVHDGRLKWLCKALST
jgi:hypothetical protein